MLTKFWRKVLFIIQGLIHSTTGLFSSKFSLCTKDKNILETHPDINTINNHCGLFKTIDSSVLNEVIHILSKRFNTDIQIKSITQLSKPKRRNLILRIRLQNLSNGTAKSLIFKQALQKNFFEDNKKAFNRFVRDSTALVFLNNLKTKSSHAPQLYGYSTKYRFILLEDLGEKHISLVDSLTGGNASDAKAALERFIKHLGQLHSDSYGQTSKYLEILHTMNPDVTSWQEDLKTTLNDTLFKIESVLKHINVSYTKELETEINIVIKAVLKPGPFITFIHGDICPDNVFDDPGENELRLIDFECSFTRSALLDGVYLRMSMPTCWCAKTIPEDLIESLELIYRKELVKHIPQARDDESYHTAYAYACAFWMLKTILNIEKLFDKDKLWGSGGVPEKSLWKAETNLGRPRVLSHLNAFIGVSKKYNKLPHIRSMAEQILKDLQVRWYGSKPMDIYPSLCIRNMK